MCIPMRIGFVFGDYTHKKFEEDIDVVSREFGTFAPLGLGFAAAIAQRAGHEVVLIDAHAEHLTPPQVLERLRPFDPQALGFMLTTYMFHDTLRYVRFLRQELQVPTIVGNVNMELYPRETLSYPEIDYGIMGPALDALPALLQALAQGRPAPDAPGLCYKRDGEVVINQPRYRAEPFDRLPFPLRDGLPMHLYHSAMSKRKNLTNLITVRGCPAACTFCHIHGIPYSARSPEGVVEEMALCAARHGVREFEIFDPSFTMKRQRILAICDGIVRRDLDVHFAVRARVDQVDPELLRRMHRAGCRRILYGLETGSQVMLDRMRKGISLEDSRRAIRWTQDAGILVIGFFLVGAPGETLQTIEQTVRFAIDAGVDYAQFHKTMAKPKTELNRQAMEALGYDYWREYVLGNAPEMRLPAPWTALSQQEVERQAIRAYHRFYMRPRYLVRTLLGVRSAEELLRYLRSGVGLLNVRTDLR